MHVVCTLLNAAYYNILQPTTFSTLLHAYYMQPYNIQRFKGMSYVVSKLLHHQKKLKIIKKRPKIAKK